MSSKGCYFLNEYTTTVSPHLMMILCLLAVIQYLTNTLSSSLEFHFLAIKCHYFNHDYYPSDYHYPDYYYFPFYYSDLIMSFTPPLAPPHVIPFPPPHGGAPSRNLAAWGDLSILQVPPK